MAEHSTANSDEGSLANMHPMYSERVQQLREFRRRSPFGHHHDRALMPACGEVKHAVELCMTGEEKAEYQRLLHKLSEVTLLRDGYDARVQEYLQERVHHADSASEGDNAFVFQVAEMRRRREVSSREHMNTLGACWELFQHELDLGRVTGTRDLHAFLP